MTCGVYQITNNVTGKFYIGSSNNIEKRLYAHFYRMRNNHHGNRYLQRVFDKYGADSFTTKILKECEKIELINCEQEFINVLKPHYNMSKIAGRVEFTPEVKAKLSAARIGKKNMLGHKHSEESKKKMSEKAKERMKSTDCRERLSAAMKGKPAWNKGLALKQEQKDYLSIALTGNKNATGHTLSEFYKEKLSSTRMGELNPFSGRKHTEATKEKMSKARKLHCQKQRENKLITSLEGGD